MAKELAVGDRAPAFRLLTDTGEISSADLKGRAYVLYFYPKDDTPGCTKEAIAFSENAAKFKARGFEIVGVSKDSTESHRKFRQKYGLKIALCTDPEKTLAQAYGVWVEKKLYGRVYMGMDRATFLVDQKGVIRQIWRNVKVPGHADAVLDAATSLTGH
jgi:peroxiredoxin Q/BCP